MATKTDTEWSSRLASIMPTNFLTNLATSYTANSNEAITTLINRIGQTVVNSVDSPLNPFAKYTQPNLEFGDTIQEIKAKFIAGTKYDSTDEDPFAIVSNDPIAMYAEVNDSTQYQDTLYDYEFKRAFMNQGAFDAFVASKLDTLAQSDALDKRIKWKKYLSSGSIAGATETIQTGTQYGENLIDAFKKYIDLFSDPSEDYNISGDTAISSSVDIIMRRADKRLIDKYLSGVFNLDKVGMDANIILIDDFATVAGNSDQLVACIVDTRAPKYTPKWATASTQYNGKALYTNYYYTVEGIYSLAKFRNFVQIFAELATYTITASTGANGSITPVGATTVNAGEDQTFYFTADEGYEIDTFAVDSVAVVPSGTSYTFTDVMGAHTIAVTWKLIA